MLWVHISPRAGPRTNIIVCKLNRSCPNIRGPNNFYNWMGFCWKTILAGLSWTRLGTIWPQTRTKFPILNSDMEKIIEQRIPGSQTLSPASIPKVFETLYIALSWLLSFGRGCIHHALTYKITSKCNNNHSVV